MDVVVGVAVTGRVARLAMVGSPASGGQVFDQYALDLPDDALTDLADTIVGTYRAVADSGNRVAATRLCLSDPSQAETLRQTVSNAGVPNVEVVAEARRPRRWPAVSARTPRCCCPTTTPSRWPWSARTRSRRRCWRRCRSVRQARPSRVPRCCSRCPARRSPGSCWSGSAWTSIRSRPNCVSTTPVEVPADAGYAIARGAAQTVESGEFPAGAATQMAPVTDATQMAPAARPTRRRWRPRRRTRRRWPGERDPAAVGPQLAYSQEEPEPTTRCPRTRSRSSFPSRTTRRRTRR